MNSDYLRGKSYAKWPPRWNIIQSLFMQTKIHSMFRIGIISRHRTSCSLSILCWFTPFDWYLSTIVPFHYSWLNRFPAELFRLRLWISWRKDSFEPNIMIMSSDNYNMLDILHWFHRFHVQQGIEYRTVYLVWWCQLGLAPACLNSNRSLLASMGTQGSRSLSFAERIWWSRLPVQWLWLGRTVYSLW